MQKKTIEKAFVKSLPLMCSYVFVSMAYGMMMQNAGFGWLSSLFVSLTVYTGAFQFVLITFLSSQASLLTIGLTAVLMNSRQAFYSITFVETFRKMGKHRFYMIHTMTDETYAVNCTIDGTHKEGRQEMFLIALFARCYWMAGAVFGGVLGQLLQFSLDGIDFCMTALFVIIFIDQWEQSDTHFPALTGLVIAAACLMIFGQTAFMLPALLLVSGILLAVSGWGIKKSRIKEQTNEHSR